MRLWAGTGRVSAFSSKPYTRMTLRTDCGLSRAERDYIRQQTRGEKNEWVNEAITEATTTE